MITYQNALILFSTWKMGPLSPCKNYTLNIGNAPYSAEITRIAPKFRDVSRTPTSI